ncbi:MAG: amidohydrolase family protein [Anaerolineae bacterium]|nr:amidohydrolase family protein [Anaerolineae bacterium]
MSATSGQVPDRDVFLSEYKPQSKLVVKETVVEKPRFPVIDAHNHLGDPFGGGWDKRPLAELLDILDQAQVRLYVDLDGGWGEDILNRHLDIFKTPAPDRFQVFGGVDWSQWEKQGNRFGEWAANRLRVQKERGAEGLKIWKPFGLHVKDHQGKLVDVGDERLDPIWQTAGELGFPVLIHVADPVAFFDPLDHHNERWEELHAQPDWQFPSPPFPSFMTIMEGLATMVARNPQTTFIGAHVGCYSENLGWVGALMDRCPNFYVDPSARISELGRQPYTARRFFLKYADRILFGTDAGANLDYYRLCYRFYETDDEYFNYGLGDVPGQGRWYIYGLHLPDDVLEKFYFKNAERILLKK